MSDNCEIFFKDGVLTNSLCPKCRLCCGPQPEEAPFPMYLLERQISDRTAEDYYLLDRCTVSLDKRGCRALGPTGCRMERSLRPVACNIFPFVLVENRLYFHTCCPAMTILSPERLSELGERIFQWLHTLPSAERKRISIARTEEDLKEKYFYLGLESEE